VVEDSVDDTTSIADRDTFACSVPTSVNEISLSTALLHVLNEFLSIFVGCSSRKAWPKQAEKVGVGSVIPRSVPANLAVKPERK
jgi:hypothetical protein